MNWLLFVHLVMAGNRSYIRLLFVRALFSRTFILSLFFTCFFCLYYYDQRDLEQFLSSPSPSPLSARSPLSVSTSAASSLSSVSTSSPKVKKTSSTSQSPIVSSRKIEKLAVNIQPSSSTSASSPPLSSSLVNVAEIKVLNESPPSPLPNINNINPANSSLSSNSNNNSTKSQNIVPRKPTFELAELETINKLLIDKSNFCDTDHGANTDLIVIVNSAIGNSAARQAIRETWGKFAVERGALFLFLLGNSNNQTLVDMIAEEDRLYGDILQGSFIDSYYNLTLKTLTMVKWISVNCEKVKFVLKVDDDMFLNMQIVVDFSETRTFSKSIIGHIAKKWKPHRDPASKWYIPMSAFNRTLLPNFATGPCYFISGDAAIPLIQTASKTKAIYLEDVYMTGIVAEAANIRRLNYSLMKNVKVKVTPCNFKRFMTSHMHSPSEIIALWNLVYDNIESPCEKPTSKSNPPAVKQAKKVLMKLAKS